MKELYDKDMREALFSYFEDSFEKIRFLEEFTMGKSRADAVMITENEMIGFELKSDKDSLVRLKRQIKDYEKYYDKNYIVVGYHYVSKIESNIPEHWGIIEIKEDNGLKVKIIRKAKGNKIKNLSSQLEFLWRSELISIMKKFKLGRVSGYSKVKLRKILREGMEPEVLKDELLHELMEREYPVIYAYLYKTPVGEITFITNAYEIELITFGDVSMKYNKNDMCELHMNIQSQMDEYFAGKRKEFDLPLEKKRFNSFTRKVYEALRTIPYGETRTYKEIAEMAMKPTSYRAVGTINNRNPYPIIVPCHRVIGANGKSTGYAGGIKFKEFLLELEKNNSK